MAIADRKDNIVLNYRFNSDCNDLTGNYNGTAHSMTYAAGKIGNAGVFDGSAGYVEVPRIASLESDLTFSISFWIYLASTPGTWDVVLRYQWGTQSVIHVTFSNSSLAFYVSSPDSGNLGTTSLSALSTETWHFVTCTYDGSDGENGYFKIYLDDDAGRSYTGASAANFEATAGSGRIGCRFTDNYFFDGMIDDFIIWDCVLTSAERTELYNSGDGLTWPFGGMSAGTFEGEGELSGDWYASAMSVGAFEGEGGLEATFNKSTVDYFYVTVSHDDDGQYNVAGIAKISASGQKLGEILWSDFNSGDDDYLPRDIAVDNSGYIYAISEDRDKVFKIDFDDPETPLWTFNISNGAATHIVVDPLGTYVYISNAYASGVLTKVNAATGVEVTTGDWPLTTTELNGDCNTLIYGRDGYIYYSDAGGSVGWMEGLISKVDPDDGTVEWEWRVNPTLSRNLWAISINTSGTLVAMHDGITTSGTISIIGDDGVTDNVWHEQASSPDFFATADGCGIAIDDDGYVYGVNSYDGLYKCIATANYNPLGNEAWIVARSPYVGVLSQDDSHLYGRAGSGLLNDFQKIDTSDGSVEWAVDHDVMEANTVKLSGTALTLPAWFVTIINPSGGSIFSNLGIEIEDSFLAVEGEDVVLTVTPDDGNIIYSVEIDGEEQ